MKQFVSDNYVPLEDLFYPFLLSDFLFFFFLFFFSFLFLLFFLFPSFYLFPKTFEIKMILKVWFSETDLFSEGGNFAEAKLFPSQFPAIAIACGSLSSLDSSLRRLPPEMS